MNISSRTLSTGSYLRAKLIQFRYGMNKHKPTDGNAKVGTRTGGQKPQAGQVIEDYQLPRRLRRPPISEEECAIINNGGRL